MQQMPPMTTITMADGLVSARPRNTNFSIAAIMSEKKAKEEMLEEEEEEEEEELEVGTESLDDVAETSLEQTDTKGVKKERRSKLTGKCNCSELESVKCTLDNKDLWDKFCEFGFGSPHI